MKMVQKFLTKWLVTGLGIIILGAMVVFRLTAYGPWGYSMSTNDTATYLNTAKLSPFSSQFFTDLRSPSYPLLFILLGPVDQYQITKVSEPYFHAEGDLAFQPGFDKVVNFQMWTSVFCWSFLALVFFMRMRNGWVRLVGEITILVFGFSPQIADWDRLIMTESLSFSLFVLILALMIELSFCLLKESRARSLYTWTILMVTALVTAFWVFLRDTNVYIVPVTLVLLLILLGLAYRKWKEFIIPVVVFFLLMIGIFVSEQLTFRASDRWIIPFYNNVTRAIFPYPQYVAYFQQHGMPTSEKLLTFRFSQQLEAADAPADFVAWTRKNGLSTYTSFVLQHPVWVIKSVLDDTNSLFNTNIQPYFFQAESARPIWLIPIADYLEPVTPLPMLLDAILGLIILGVAIQQRKQEAIIWAWVVVWLYGISMALYVTGYIGETRSVLRHVMGGVVPLRLALWLFIAIVAELLFFKPSVKLNENNQP